MLSVGEEFVRRISGTNRVVEQFGGCGVTVVEMSGGGVTLWGWRGLVGLCNCGGGVIVL